MSDDKENNGEMLHCSFCGKSQAEVKKLVAGRGVYIAMSALKYALTLWRTNWKKNARQKPEFHLEKLPTPSKIKEIS